MQSGRSKLDDRALCLHEAAHAVTAEILRPDCVVGVQMDVIPGTPTVFGGYAYSEGVEAVCNWRIWPFSDTNQFITIAAGREGEKIEEEYARLFRFDYGDLVLLRAHATVLQRRRARSRASSLVRKNEMAVRRVARALAEKRTMNGDEIRAVMA